MSRNESLCKFRPLAAAKRLAECGSPAVVLSGLDVQRALHAEKRRLFVFEISSPALLAKGLLRAAMQLDAVIALTFRPRPKTVSGDFAAFSGRVFQACDEMGFRHPMVLSAGPFALPSSVSDEAASALKVSILEALEAGFTDISIAVDETPDENSAAALKNLAQTLEAKHTALEVVLPTPDAAPAWRDVLAGVSSVVLSASDADWILPEDVRAGEFHGLRSESGEFPDTEQVPADFEGRFDRLTGDPLSEIAMQVLDEGSAAEVERLTSEEGVRMTDAVADALGDASDIATESVLWTEQNTYFFALDLLRTSGCKGSAASVRRYLAPEVPDTDPEAELNELLAEEIAAR